MTPFWKEERWGYNIYQNEQKNFFDLDPPRPLIYNSLTIKKKNEFQLAVSLKLNEKIFLGINPIALGCFEGDTFWPLQFEFEIKVIEE